jgi:peptide/nickel transport system permease protein
LTIWIVSLLAFVIIQLPEGDSVDKHLDKMMQEGDEFSLQTAERLRKHLGLDKPMHIRYGKWMWNMAHGDLGTSFLLPLAGPRRSSNGWRRSSRTGCG